ncbi:unnamed protein product [Plutella xylostella]|uniref:(diamondback moth) hypothetical protein n=1 Tax=Plutella xylostella TaxID=51655 RepID=A0A8S4G2I3_PLUXY|nr:unnamed protein product [Plutella xylostella]
MSWEQNFIATTPEVVVRRERAGCGPRRGPRPAPLTRPVGDPAESTSALL